MSDQVPKCSRAGCKSDATCLLIWRNPKIHTDDRRKQWLACDEHESFLVDYLSARGFYLDTEKLA